MCEGLGNLYQKEWNSLFCMKYYVENLRSSGGKGKLRNSRFRSICWKILLECLPEDQQSWIDTVKLHRKHYDEILDKFHVNPRKLQETMDLNVNNPLSQSHQSPWNQYFEDSELKITIQQDVVRTFPEIDFFQSSRVQEMMINILFSYARENPHVSYKQGMHELLAPIIFVLDYDQQAYLEVSKTDNLDLDIRIMLNQNYIEHDAFTLFSHLMEVVKAWYMLSDSPYSECVTMVSSEPFSENLVSPINSLGVKLRNIYKQLLKHHDVELFLYLEQMEITPQIYGIRWLRLLFGREFPIHDLLIVWDAIFADGISFNLVDYIFVAMLIAIRDLLLKSDYASCLCHLMHYPNVTDVQCIVNLALHLRDPGMGKPDISFIQVSDAPKTKENKPCVKSSFPKNVFSGQTKSISMNKKIVNRPKSLKIASSSNSINGASFGNDLDNNCEKMDKTSCEIVDTCEESVDVFLCVDKGNYNTFPRASIRNVMENKNLKTKTFEVSQSFGHVENKNIPSGSVCKEMVPLVPSNKTLPSDHSIKKKMNRVKDKIGEVKLKLLETEISELKNMNEYCAKQITHNITKLQECMIGQRLLYEDEMFVALAGLKRARDILKRTVAFNEEIMDDDHLNSYTSYSLKENYAVNNTCSDVINSQNSNLELTKSSELCQKNCSKNAFQNQASNSSQNINQACDKIQHSPKNFSQESDKCDLSSDFECVDIDANTLIIS